AMATRCGSGSTAPSSTATARSVSAAFRSMRRISPGGTCPRITISPEATMDIWSGTQQRGAHRVRWWLAAVCAAGVIGAGAATATAITFSAQTLPFTDLTGAGPVAVDEAGDVFVVDVEDSRVVELPAGSSQQTVVPFTGLFQLNGVAVDRVGDVFAA